MNKLPISDTQWNFFPPEEMSDKTNNTSTVAQFYLYLFIVWSIFWFCGLVWFLCLRSSTEIQMRSPWLVIMSAVGAELALLCTTLDILLTHEHYPCFLNLWYTMLFFPLFFVPFVLRFLCYYFKMRELDRWKKGLIKDPTKSVWVLESTWMTILGYIMTLMMTAGVVMQFTKPVSEWLTTFGCQITPVTSSVLIAMLVICLLIAGTGYFFMKNISDPYKIKSELVSCFVTWFFTLGPYIFIDWFLPRYSNNTTFLMYIFIISGYFSSVIVPIYRSYMMPPEQQTKEKILDTLEQILMDDEGFVIVSEYSASQSAPENPPFLKEVIEFKKLDDPTEMKNRAQFIFQRFVNPGAEQQVNIPASMVAELRERIDNPTSDMFNPAYREVMKLLKTNFLRGIKSLDSYTELVKKREKEREEEEMGNKMIHTV